MLVPTIKEIYISSPHTAEGQQMCKFTLCCLLWGDL